jgi:hypothetical protein
VTDAEPKGDARTWKVYRSERTVKKAVQVRTRITRRVIPPTQLRKGETVVKEFSADHLYVDVLDQNRKLAEVA